MDIAHRLTSMLKAPSQVPEGDAAIIINSDRHRGSVLAVWPTSVMLPNGSPWTPNVVQEWLAEKEREFWQWARSLTKGRRTICVENGDLCEGKHHYISELVTSNLEFQRRAMVASIEEVKRPKDTWKIIRGTAAHDGSEGQDAETVAREIGCSPSRSGLYSCHLLSMTVNDVVIKMAHHIGTTRSPVTEMTAPMSMLVFENREAGRWGERPADILVFAHRHAYDYLEIAARRRKQAVLITAGWQAKSEHVMRLAPITRAQVGGAVILIDKDGTWGVEGKVWDIPGPEMEVL